MSDDHHAQHPHPADLGGHALREVVRHDWTEDGEAFAVIEDDTYLPDVFGLPSLQLEGRRFPHTFADSGEAPIAREILRLAERVRELEMLEGEQRGRAEFLCVQHADFQARIAALEKELVRKGHEILALQGEKAALFAGRFPEVATRIQALEEENQRLRLDLARRQRAENPLAKYTMIPWP